MARVEVILPQMGEGVIEATITRWLADVNQDVEEDEPIIEIATDKVDSEIPSPLSGKLIKKFFSEGEIPKVGEVLAIIESESSVGHEAENPEEDILKESRINSQDLLLDVFNPQESDAIVGEARFDKNQLPLTPFIRFFAQSREVSYDELKKLKGTGNGGAVLKADVINYIKAGRPLKEKTAHICHNDREHTGKYIPKDGETLVEIDRTRRLIAEHMVTSAFTAPHVTSFIEIDVTPLVVRRENIKEEFRKKHGVNITYTAIIVDVVVNALKDFPRINVSFVNNSQLIIKKYINIGIATALPNNNLIVPVIKNADQKNLQRIAVEILEKTERARKNELVPGETNDGTFTITNLGMVGNVSGTPIINQPESAILAVGAIKKKPGVVMVNEEPTIGIRDMLTLSLSYDHRVIDGSLGGAFLSKVGELLENYKLEVG